MDQCDSERHSERLARLEEHRHLVDERFVSRDKALDVATSHQKDVDEKLNDVRVRFVDKEAYEKDMRRVEDTIANVALEMRQNNKGNTQWLIGVLASVVMLLLLIVADIATRL